MDDGGDSRTQVPEARPQGDVTAWHWAVLAISTLAASATSAFVVGVAFLIPHLHAAGVSLTAAGVLVAMPNVGVACALVAWGSLVDARGERLALTSGAALTALAIGASMWTAVAGGTQTAGLVWLGVLFTLGGAASAAANSASGRVVVGWFPPQRRGLAMGIRQMSQPAGVAVAAMTMPWIAGGHGVSAALGVPMALAAASAVLSALVVKEPPRPDKSSSSGAVLGTSPYRVPYLWRIHATSVLLVLPQTLMQSWLLVWLVVGEGWNAVAAGTVVTVTQVLGGIGRIVVGGASDRLPHRNWLLRWVAMSAAVAFGALTVAEALGVPNSVAIAVAVIASVIAVADNGLAFTSVAEFAGPFWSGRALGVQNTMQFLAVSAATPLFAAVISGHGFVWAFALATLAGMAAIPVVPRRDERREDSAESPGAAET